MANKASIPEKSSSLILLRFLGKEIETFMMKRNEKLTFGGTFAFPGGKIDKNELSQDCAKRELFEETGL